jgi:hypothetical protein
MRKTVVILFLSLFSIGNVLFPGEDWASLQKTYHQCQAEDPDLGIVDFVFGHLLELPDVFDSLEGGDDDKTEKPHQSVPHLNFAAHVIITAPAPVSLGCRRVVFYTVAKKYPAANTLHLPSGHLSEILRPPIA